MIVCGRERNEREVDEGRNLYKRESGSQPLGHVMNNKPMASNGLARPAADPFPNG